MAKVKIEFREHSGGVPQGEYWQVEIDGSTAVFFYVEGDDVIVEGGETIAVQVKDVIDADPPIGTQDQVPFSMVEDPDVVAASLAHLVVVTNGWYMEYYGVGVHPAILEDELGWDFERVE